MRRAAAILALCAAAACGDDGEPAGTPARETVEVEVVADGRTVVAEVNGRPVFDDCVAAQARGHGLDARAALDECIDFELLAQEAEKRGFAGHPEAREVQRREAVRRLLITDFEANHDGPEDVPMSVVLETWRKPVVHSRYNHPEYRFCHYVRAPVPQNAERGGPEDRAAEAAIRRVHKILAAAEPLSRKRFGELIHENAEGYAFEVSDKQYNTPRKGRSDEDFARALFEIPHLKAVSKPVRTRWGWDVILLTRISPSRRQKVEEVADEIRAAIFVQWRERAFMEWSKALSRNRHTDVPTDWASRLPTDPFELP
jgi:peptidyl-prolyl cis-trans isomerase C